jgi:hypothetical protein
MLRSADVSGMSPGAPERCDPGELTRHQKRCCAGTAEWFNTVTGGEMYACRQLVGLVLALVGTN